VGPTHWPIGLVQVLTNYPEKHKGQSEPEIQRFRGEVIVSDPMFNAVAMFCGAQNFLRKFTRFWGSQNKNPWLSPCQTQNITSFVQINV
jgi:hypothetical protein